MRKIGEMLEGDRMSTSEDRGKAGHREREIEKRRGLRESTTIDGEQG
jgi:hypothetical protein